MNQLAPQYNSIWAILVMLAVLALCYFVTKWLAKGVNRSSMTRGSYMRILDRIAVSRDKYILLVEAGGRAFLIGVTNQAVSVISELDGLSELPPPPGPTNMTDFMRKWMQSRAARKMGKDPGEVYKHIDSNETAEKDFRSFLNGTGQESKMNTRGEQFSTTLEDMDEKMRARAEKFKNRNQQ